ncbi:hypothetical protein OH77DRAFT_1325071 [Trametes cingulata]|nr:hypothetical protein OH77DRAFT_1325071 [Trametes cingulata]
MRRWRMNEHEEWQRSFCLEVGFPCSISFPCLRVPTAAKGAELIAVTWLLLSDIAPRLFLKLFWGFMRITSGNTSQTPTAWVQGLPLLGPSSEPSQIEVSSVYEPMQSQPQSKNASTFSIEGRMAKRPRRVQKACAHCRARKRRCSGGGELLLVQCISYCSGD